MTCRERALTAIAGEEPDRVPLIFLGNKTITPAHREEVRWAQDMLALGLDARLRMPGPTAVKREVAIRDWVEHPDGERYPILVREYETPLGPLRHEIRQSEDYGDDGVPLFSDLNVARARKHLVEDWEDLRKLESMLATPADCDLSEMEAQIHVLKDFCEREQVPLEAWGGQGGDTLTWLSGVHNAAMWVYDQPDFVQAYLEVTAQWELSWIEYFLTWHPDWLYRRGWYEPPPQWSPELLRRYFLPPLEAALEMAHQASVPVAHLASSGNMTMAPIFVEIGLDIHFGIDPVQSDADLSRLKREYGDRLCFWGGVNAPLTLENGTPEQVRRATKEAILTLGPGGGFILSGVDSVNDPSARENTEAMIETWRDLCRYPLGG